MCILTILLLRDKTTIELSCSLCAATGVFAFVCVFDEMFDSRTIADRAISPQSSLDTAKRVNLVVGKSAVTAPDKEKWKRRKSILTFRVSLVSGVEVD